MSTSEGAGTSAQHALAAPHQGGWGPAPPHPGPTSTLQLSEEDYVRDDVPAAELWRRITWRPGGSQGPGEPDSDDSDDEDETNDREQEKYEEWLRRSRKRPRAHGTAEADKRQLHPARLACEQRNDRAGVACDDAGVLQRLALLLRHLVPRRHRAQSLVHAKWLARL